MMKSKLPNSVLRRIWALSDIDQDGQLDRDEFAVALFLIDHKLSKNDLPETLPERLIPPSKRLLVRNQHYGGGSRDGGGRREQPEASLNAGQRGEHVSKNIFCRFLSTPHFKHPSPLSTYCAVVILP